MHCTTYCTVYCTTYCTMHITMYCIMHGTIYCNIHCKLQFTMYCSVQHCTALHPAVRDTHQQMRLLDFVVLLFTLHYHEVKCTEETVQNYNKGEGESSNKLLGISQIQSSQCRGHSWATRVTTSHTQYMDVTFVGLKLNLHGTTVFLLLVQTVVMLRYVYFTRYKIQLYDVEDVSQKKIAISYNIFFCV